MLAIEIVVYLWLWMNTCAVQQGVKKYQSFSVVFARKRRVNRLAFFLSLTWNLDESSTYTPSLARHSKEHNNNNSSELSCEIFVYISLIATPILSTYQKDFNSQDVDPPKSNKHKFTSSLRKSMIVTSKSRRELVNKIVQAIMLQLLVLSAVWTRHKPFLPWKRKKRCPVIVAEQIR